MDKLSQKRNLSCIQVIKTLQLLFQGNYSMSELIDKLNANEPDSIFNNSVVSKYINTCRFYGIEIPKINNKYYVAHVPFGMELSLEEIELFNRLESVITMEFPSKCSKIYKEFIRKLSRFSDKNIVKVSNDCIHISYEIFEKAVAKKRKVKLLFKNQTVCECIPLQIVETDKKRYFKVYYKKERMIDINRLSGLEVTDNKFVSSYGGEQSVIFRLTAPLAQRYEPREGENTNMNADGSLDVINRTEPKEILFSRLMRYDTKCEIISPKSYRAEFQQMINDTLKNYEDLNG